MVLVATFVMGAAWMLTLTTLNASAQMTLPNHLRARGMGSYMTVMAPRCRRFADLGPDRGTDRIGSDPIVAAATLLVTAAIKLWFPIDEA